MHNNILITLEDRLKRSKRYSSIHTNYEYERGEIDLWAKRMSQLALRKPYILLFEIKSNYHDKGTKKAKEQLDRAAKEFKKYRVFKIIAYGNRQEDGYFLRWYK